ncbi:serine/threonine protein kinase, partial [bacterium]|nr:serine/threonine protein kinase [bacterium]
ILDFGLAKSFLDAEAEKLTKTGALVGTVSYMSPEQAGVRSLDVGPASDVFSLGIVLYEMLTGTLPFPGDSAVAVLAKIVHTPPPYPRSLSRNVPAELEAVCMKALAKDPVLRYPDGTAFALDLEEFLKGNKVSAPATGRSRAARVVALALAVLALAIGGALLARARPSSSPERGAPPGDDLAALAAKLRARLSEVRASEKERRSSAIELSLAARSLEEKAARLGPEQASQARGARDAALDVHLWIFTGALEAGALDDAETGIAAAKEATGGDEPLAIATARALLLERRGKAVQALPALEAANAAQGAEATALQATFGSVRLAEALALALVASGRAADAVPAFDRALAAARTDAASVPRLRLARARAKLAARDAEGAIADYEAATRSSQDGKAPLLPACLAGGPTFSEFAPAYATRGVARLQAKKLEEAAAAFRAACELDPSAIGPDLARRAADAMEKVGTESLRGLASAFDARTCPTPERVREAHGLLDAALRLDPEREAAIHDEIVEIELTIMDRDWPAHAGAVRFLIAARLRRLKAKFGVGRFRLATVAAAERALREELAQAGADLPLVVKAYRGFSHCIRGQDPEVAFEGEEEFAPLCPRERIFEWEVTRGLTLAAMGRADDAQKLLDDAVSRSSEASPAERVDTLFWRGTAEHQLGRDEQAVRDLRAALELDRTAKFLGNGWPEYNLAASLHALGRESLALEALERSRAKGGTGDDKVDKLEATVKASLEGGPR